MDRCFVVLPPDRSVVILTHGSLCCCFTTGPLCCSLTSEPLFYCLTTGPLYCPLTTGPLYCSLTTGPLLYRCCTFIATRKTQWSLSGFTSSSFRFSRVWRSASSCGSLSMRKASLVLLFLLSLSLLLMWCGRYVACDTHLETDLCLLFAFIILCLLMYSSFNFMYSLFYEPAMTTTKLPLVG